jgi:protein arginine N-methyltransferase 1
MFSIRDYGDMIADKARMDPYIYALKAAIEPASVVLDIGTGTGMHALLACKFGARVVYALEPNEAIHLARELAVENGYADRIEFIQDISSHVSLPEKADVIVSDLRGVLPLHGRHIPDIIDARQRFLAPGGILIPKCDTIRVALVEARAIYQDLSAPWDYPYGISMEGAEKVVLNDWSDESTLAFNKSSLLMEPQIWAEIDYETIENPEVDPTLIVQPAGRTGTAHGLLMWFDGEIADGIRVFNGPSAEKVAKAYGCGFFPLLEPVSIVEGDRITLDIQAKYIRDQYAWNWNTLIQSGDNPRTIKANFEQSSDFEIVPESAELHKSIQIFRPSRGEAGEIVHFILGMMDGRESINKIARQARAKFPSRFKSLREAQFYVNELSHDFCVQQISGEVSTG